MDEREKNSRERRGTRAEMRGEVRREERRSEERPELSGLQGLASRETLSAYTSAVLMHSGVSHWVPKCVVESDVAILPETPFHSTQSSPAQKRSHGSRE